MVGGSRTRGETGKRVEYQHRVAAAELVDGLLDVTDEDGSVCERRQLQKQRQLHRIRVLKFVHQEQFDFVAQAFAHRILIQGVQRQLLHVGEVDEAVLALDGVEAGERVGRNLEDAGE